MPVGKKVSFLGAGSLRAAAPVLASLFNFPLTPENRIALCDPDEEVLDLVDRLARSFAAAQEYDVIITATSDQTEALADSDTVILAFGLGTQRERTEGLLGEHASMARGILLAPAFETVNRLLSELPRAPRVINLVEPVGYSGKLLSHEAQHLSWPPCLPVSERVPAAHQILRWVRGDDRVFEPLGAFADSALVAALVSGAPSHENRFDPTAAAVWAAAIDTVFPGKGEELLATG